MVTLLTKGGNSITVSDETADQMMRDEPGAYVIVTTRRVEKIFHALANKMAEAVGNK